MKRICIAVMVLSAGIASAQDTAPDAKVTQQMIVDAVNADLAAAAAEESTMEARKKANQDAKAAGCALQGAMVQDIVARKRDGEPLGAVQAAIAANPDYALVPNRDMLTNRVEMIFNFMGGMKPEVANTRSVAECMKT